MNMGEVIAILSLNSAVIIALYLIYEVRIKKLEKKMKEERKKYDAHLKSNHRILECNRDIVRLLNSGDEVLQDLVLRLYIGRHNEISIERAIEILLKNKRKREKRLWEIQAMDDQAPHILSAFRNLSQDMGDMVSLSIMEWVIENRASEGDIAILQRYVTDLQSRLHAEGML